MKRYFIKNDQGRYLSKNWRSTQVGEYFTSRSHQAMSWKTEKGPIAMLERWLRSNKHIHCSGWRFEIVAEEL